MSQDKKQFSASSEASKKQTPIGLVVALAAAGGVVIGSAGTYFLTKPLAAPKQSTSPAAGGTPQAQTITMPTQPQFTPALQPPGEAPPGKVWSVEHGHWHDAPTALTIPAAATATVTPAATTIPAPATATPTPAAAPASAPATVTPAAAPPTTPAPEANPKPAPAAPAPAEKKE